MLLQRKKIKGGSLSILNGSHIAYVSSSDDLREVVDGTYLTINSQNAFYFINKKEECVFMFNNCIIEGLQTIVINEIVAPHLQVEDVIKISYKELELDTVVSILDAGTGYSVGDVLTLEGGIGVAAQINVIGVEEGKIKRINIKNRGRYVMTSSTECFLSGGTGKNAKIGVSFIYLNEYTTVTNRIIQVNSSVNKIIVETPLPRELKVINISCSKWQLYLNIPYTGPTLFNTEYSISRDFTPVLNLPTMAKNSFTMDIVYNQAVHMLEQEIIKLQKRLDYLESKS